MRVGVVRVRFLLFVGVVCCCLLLSVVCVVCVFVVVGGRCLLHGVNGCGSLFVVGCLCVIAVAVCSLFVAGCCCSVLFVVARCLLFVVCRNSSFLLLFTVVCYCS